MRVLSFFLKLFAMFMLIYIGMKILISLFVIYRAFQLATFSRVVGLSGLAFVLFHLVGAIISIRILRSSQGIIKIVPIYSFAMVLYLFAYDMGRNSFSFLGIILFVLVGILAYAERYFKIKLN